MLKKTIAILPALIIAGIVLSYFAYIRAYGVNVPFWGGWWYVPVYRQFVCGHMSLRQLFCFYSVMNVHIMFFSYLFMGLVYFLTGFNVKILMYCDALAQVLSFVLLWRLSAKNLPDSKYKRWHAVPLACLMFSFCQYPDILWGFQSVWCEVILFTLLALSALEESFAGGRSVFVGTGCALACAVVASYSAMQGMGVWPAGLAYLALRKGKNLKGLCMDRQFWAWLCAGAAVTFLYLSVAHRSFMHGPPFSVAPGYDLKFLLSLMGAVWGSADTMALGVAESVLIALAAVRIAASRRKSAYALPAALIVLALVIDVLTFMGRGQSGLRYALAPRYKNYNLLLMAGIYLIFSTRETSESEPRSGTFWARLACGGLLSLVFAISDASLGLANGRQWRARQMETVFALKNYRGESRAGIVSLVCDSLSYGDITADVDFLKSHRLSVFSGNL